MIMLSEIQAKPLKNNLFSILMFLSFTILSCKANYSFVEKYPKKKVPLVDSTSFSNHQSKKILSKRKLKKLHLETILGKEQLFAKKSKIGISYLPLLSSNYTSIVYYFYSDDTVLQSILVNYDINFNVIDYQILAFDEISDGLLKSSSIINSNEIKLSEYNFHISKNPMKLMYLISSDGKITQK